MADPEVDLFAGMKKKKKKVVAANVEESPAPAAPAEEPASPTPAPVERAPEPTPAPAPEPSAEPSAEDGGDLFADLKKKKKKKKEIPLDLETAVPAEGAAPADLPMKKKKSKKPAADFAKELDELDADQADDAAEDDGDLGEDVFKASGEGASETGGLDAWVVENRDPTYPELLQRFFTLLHLNNPELAGEKRRFVIVPPQVAREGTKKTMFANFIDITRRLHRQPEHVLMFLYAELGTQGSMDGAQRLVLRGRYTQKQIENVLRKYITEYVSCKICKSPDTLLGKENRLYFLTCESCGSRRSVSAIKSGFQAQIGRRVRAP
ncbi:translation initiation factor eIF-2 beta subunit [Cryptotrichosporon argae]